MSLINDALKRARHAHAQPTPAALAEPALQTALVPAQAPQARAAWIAPATGFLALLLGLGCLGLYWLRAGPSVALAARPAAQARVLVSSNSPAPSQRSTPAKAAQQIGSRPAVTNTPANLPVLSALPSAMSAPTDSAAPSPTAAIAQAAAPPAPEPDPVIVLPDASPTGFKLQGIFYGTSRSVAMINGRTVARNDEVNGAKVLEIERQGVRLLIQGRTNVLKLR